MNYDWLIAHRQVVTAGVAVLPLLLSFLIVRALVWKYRNLHSEVANFGTTHDRTLTNLQFWSVVAVSLALPGVAAGLAQVVGVER